MMTDLPEMQRMLRRLVDAGWASETCLIEDGPASVRFRVEWTEAGKHRMRALTILFAELEHDKVRVQPGETETLRSLVALFHQTDPAPRWPPELPR